MYTLNSLTLWVTKKISWPTVVYAWKQRPVAVAGYAGSYHVGPCDLNI